MSRITKTVSDAQISNIRQKFQEADDNSNGFLTVEELKHFLELVGAVDADASTVMTKIGKGRDVVNFFTLMQTYEIWSAGIPASAQLLFPNVPTYFSRPKAPQNKYSRLGRPFIFFFQAFRR